MTNEEQDQVLMDDFFASVSYDQEINWQAMPELGEEDDSGAALETLTFDPSQPRDKDGKWSGGSAPRGRQTRTDYQDSILGLSPEAQTQQALAEQQTNTLANPPFVLGMENAQGHEHQRYVAAYGQEFIAQPLPANVKPGTPRECYKNASLLVMQRPDLTYAEGFATTPETGGLAFLHAWAVDKNNNVVDPTWQHPEHSRYFGVKYDRSAYLQYLYKAKLYGVLGSTFKNAQGAIATGGKGLRP
jgi:hypothetical protein